MALSEIETVSLSAGKILILGEFEVKRVSTYKVGAGMAVCLWLISLLAMVSPAWSAPAVTNDGDPEGKASSKPYDLEFLKDQINLKLSLGGEGFVEVATKPGEMIYVDKAEGTRGKVFKYAFIVQPEVYPGQWASTRQEAQSVSSDYRTYRIQVFCLNPFDDDPEKLPPFGTCVPRPVEGDGKKDAVDRLADLKAVNEGDPFPEKVTGLSIQVTSYELSKPLLVGEVPQRAKCCIQSESLNVCGCRVLSSYGFCAMSCH